MFLEFNRAAHVFLWVYVSKGCCDRALDTALITAPEARDKALCERLDAVAGRVLAG